MGKKTYRIAFMDQRVQERVLDRRDRVISLPGRELGITVSRDRPPSDPTPPPTPSDNKRVVTCGLQEAEKVVIMNQYLLQYLKDCPKAAQALSKQLDSTRSSVELHPEKEEAVVKSVAGQLEPSVTATWVEWMSQVEQIFDDVKSKYHCHFEIDPARLKILRRNISSLETEDVRVYWEEDTFAVVVGETSEVNKSLNILEEMLQTRKNYSILERQYNLVKEELERELTILSPRVKISYSGPDTLVLEGPNKEVQLGLTKLEELENRIIHKKVWLPKTLLDFLVSSGSIHSYQARFQRSLRKPVALETGLDLLLSSLSLDALEEAEATILRDLRLDTQLLDGALGLSPALDKLKQSLRKVQDEANVAGTRVEVRYQQGSSGDPKTTVQMVGYSEEVERLTEVLLDYKLQGGDQGQNLDPQGGYFLSGLMQPFQDFWHRWMRVSQQNEMYARVTWCMMGPGGDWERFPKEANLQLEMGEVQAGVADWMSRQWRVDLTKMEVTDQGSGRVAKLKRLENIGDFSLPLEWDSMDSGESLILVDLPTTSSEFCRVKEDFTRTASNKTVLKIERVQNVHLRQAYELSKKSLERIFGPERGAREMLLYYGTTPEASQSILEIGFNRSLGGHNETTIGTYFAVNASYSTDPAYSRPDQDGNQKMFVARVLTGLSTYDRRDMWVPPAGYDSLVDNEQSLTMFAVFDFMQAYPDYLITFK